ncbi:MAG: AAA domain-containing protein, partial [Sphaerochaetaceae bacterium]
TGALALSCAKNAVIVGDLKQIPNVIKDNMKNRADAIFASYKLSEGYSFTNNSFLKSICSILPNAPQVLLREHYRCHPKIIGFCNQKFYDNNLIIMTEDKKEPDTISVYKTLVGNHEREHFNQRHIDVIREEVLPRLQQENIDDIGIIAPYNAQVDAIKEQLTSDTIDIATVHKFQGREKDTIILTSVDDVITEFSDNPHLLNVAVSRAKNHFYLVVSGNEQPKNSNIRDLISYIEYSNFQIIQSKIYSVFDYLYQQYTVERMEYLKGHKRISQYDSENLMYGTIVDLLAHYKTLSLSVICHQPLNMLFRDTSYLSNEEYKYVINTATHVDFLVYNKISKKPVFAIEVDGFHYHKEGTRQKRRDQMKDHIFELYTIPLLRFPTTGSGEREKIEQILKEYAETHE